MPIRIALFGIYHESNTFIDLPTTIDDFSKGHWIKGKEVLLEYRHAFHEIGGMIEELERNQVEIVPVSFAEATPGGTVAASAFEQLLGELTSELSAVLPVHGCIIALHGAAVSEQYPDMDGHWLSVIRAMVGNGIPMVGTLDPHANVSEKMVAATNALFSYKTNPHIDQRETGRAAAKMLLKIIKGELQPVQQLVPSPVAISIEQQHTGSEPCLGLYEFVNKMQADSDLLHISVNLGFPYADVEEMGTSFIVIHDSKNLQAEKTTTMLDGYMRSHKDEFVGARKKIEEVMPLIKKSLRPVLLLDMGDNIGGGAPGNSLHLLRTFELHADINSLHCIYAPDSVSYLENKPGQLLSMPLKDALGPDLTVTGHVLRVFDGKFVETNPRHGGQVHYDMGMSIVFETVNGNTLLLMSNRVPPFSLRQLTSFELHPENYDVVVAKGVIAPIAAYGPVCKTIIQVDTPGTTRADMTEFPYKNRRRPLFPFEQIL